MNSVQISRSLKNCKSNRLRVLYVGSGAVNLCLAGWMHSGTTSTSFLVRTEDNELIKAQAFQCSLPGDKNFRVYTCKAFASLENVPAPELVVIGVKNYSLDAVLDTIEKAYGKDIPIMSVLNGVSHVTELKNRFPNAMFATIAFNAYRTSQIAAVAVGGTVGLSSFDESNPTMVQVHKVLKRKISVSLVKNPYDAAHCKLIVNLGNALLTLVAFHDNRNREVEEMYQLSMAILWEGVQVLRKSAVKEARISGMLPWLMIWLGKTLPSKWMVPIFMKKMQASSINSMAQDLNAGSTETELEEINGYFLEMAEKAGVAVHYNRALYHIFKEWLASGDQPLTPSVLLEKVNSFSKR